MIECPFEAAEIEILLGAGIGLVSAWADRERILPIGGPGGGGRYRTALTPYMKKPMDCFCDAEVEEITLMMASQIGKSAGLENMIGWSVCENPRDILMVRPRAKDLRNWVTDIARPMINECPAVKRHTTGSPQDITNERIDFDRMSVHLGAAESPADLASISAAVVIFDESDKYPIFSGRESNPIDLGSKRARNFFDSKIVKACTATTTDGNINISYCDSNMEQCVVPCPYCGEYRVWKMEFLKIEASLRDPDEIIAKGQPWYECEVCGRRIEETQKMKLVAAGIWIAEGEYVDADGNIRGQAKRSRRHSGFKLNALVAPFPKVDWRHIMADFFRAQTERGKATGKMLDFWNNTLGEPYVERERMVEKAAVEKLVGDHSIGTVPTDALILIASADYHESEAKKIVTLNYEVTAFGYDLQNWVVKVGIVHSFAELDKAVLESPFAWSDGTPAEEKPWMAVSVLFIDAGFEPDKVCNYCRQHPAIKIPTKGLEGPRPKLLQWWSIEDIVEWRLPPKLRARYKGLRLMLVDTYSLKDIVTGWLGPSFDAEGNETTGPKTSYFREIGRLAPWYLKEMTNEEKRRERDRAGNVKLKWRPVYKGAPTHGLDLAVLRAAAAYFKRMQYKVSPAAMAAAARPAAIRGKRMSRRMSRSSKSGFLDNLPSMNF